VAQNAVAELGSGWLGQPRWTLVGLPLDFVRVCEYGFLVLGLVGSLLVSYRLAESADSDHPGRIFATWALVSVALWCAAIWLMTQPMEMRGVILAGG
jgi:hypothetical protein